MEAAPKFPVPPQLPGARKAGGGSSGSAGVAPSCVALVGAQGKPTGLVPARSLRKVAASEVEEPLYNFG